LVILICVLRKAIQSVVRVSVLDFTAKIQVHAQKQDTGLAVSGELNVIN